jgi:hypothetical protein
MLTKSGLQFIARYVHRGAQFSVASSIAQVCELAPFNISKLYYEFESTPLRHTV